MPREYAEKDWIDPLGRGWRERQADSEWMDRCRGKLSPERIRDEIRLASDERREREKRGYDGGVGDPHVDPLAAIRRF